MQLRKLVLCFLSLILLTSIPLAGFAADGATVFREITFGDSQKTVRREALEDDFFKNPMVNLGKEALSPRGKEDLVIDGHSFQLIFFFNQAGLYRLDLMGPSRDKDQFESLRQAAETLRAVLVPGLNEPSNSRRVKSTQELGDGFTTIHYWSSEHTPGKQEAFVGIASGEDGYQASLIIKDPSRANANPLPSGASSPPELSTDEAARLFSAS